MAAAQRFIEAALDTGQALVVHPGIADDMGESAALRVDPLFLVLEIEAGDTEGVHRCHLTRGELALDPDEALVRAELGVNFALVEVGQYLDELAGRIACVDPR